MTPEPQTPLGGCRTVAVGDAQAPAIIVMCHGFAMTPDELAPFAESLGIGARWLFPEAPVPASLVPGRVQGRSWWHIDPTARLEALARGRRSAACRRS